MSFNEEFGGGGGGDRWTSFRKWKCGEIGWSVLCLGKVSDI